MQRAVLDFVALAQGCVCSLRPAVPKLTKNPPQPRLCSGNNIIMLPATLAALMYIFASIVFYRAQEWYHEGASSSYKVLLSSIFGGVACMSDGLAQHGDNRHSSMSATSHL